MKKFRFLVTLVLSSMYVFASYANPDAILGVWQNGTGRGHVQIYKENGKYYGKVIWLKIPVDASGHPKLDVKNQDANLRNKSLIGLTMLKEFIYEDGEWTGGKIYNPEDGKEYKCILKLKDDKTLKVRGFIGFSWIGKTDIWQRVR